MKSALVLLCAAATVAQIADPSSASAFSEKVRFDRRPAMQPIRRLGLLPVVHNVTDARRTLSDQIILRGILAQPIAPEDFAQKFNTALKAVTDASGRFWTMEAISAEVVAGRSAATAEMSSFQRAQLVNEYDLDGWLKADVYFTADHTAIRVTMMGPQLKPVIAREDVLLPYGADWEALANGFAQAVGRLSETIGHDGRVVFENSELFGIDFGSERGIVVGQRLKAGLVVQSAAHPQTGEVLRYQRHPLYEIEVVDVKQGASLARKISFDPDSIKQAESAYGSGTDRKFQLLVWRDTSETSRVSVGGWKSLTGNASRVDAGPAGFTPRESLASPAAGQNMQKPTATSSTARDSDLPRSLPSVALVSPGAFPVSSSKRDGEAFFSTMKFAAGSSNGTLELSKGPVDSQLPGYLLNTFSLQDGFRYSGEWNIRYGAEYAMFSGPMSGSRFSFRGGGYAPASTLQIPDFPLNWGAEAQYSTGSVKTEKSKKTFDAFELFGTLSTERSLEGGWGLGIEYKQSFTGLLAGAFAFEAAIDVHPGAPAPRELGVQWRYINDGDRWTEWLLGLTWKLGAVE